MLITCKQKKQNSPKVVPALGISISLSTCFGHVFGDAYSFQTDPPALVLRTSSQKMTHHFLDFSRAPVLTSKGSCLKWQKDTNILYIYVKYSFSLVSHATTTNTSLFSYSSFPKYFRKKKQYWESSAKLFLRYKTTFKIQITLQVFSIWVKTMKGIHFTD